MGLFLQKEGLSMFYLQTVGVAIGLSMDAFAVTLANMMAYSGQLRGGKKCMMPLFFAVFQGLMPLLGALLGGVLARFVTRFAPWILFAVLCAIGGKMIWDYLHEGKDADAPKAQKPCSVALLLLQAIATSIDAFAVGVGYAVSGQNAFAAVPIIAITTFVICGTGVLLGKKLSAVLENKATLFGGLILIAIGIISLFS